MRPNAPQPAQQRHAARSAGREVALDRPLGSWRYWLLVLVTTALLTACGLPRRIDSDVQSFVGTPAAVTPATYRFERLPSQVNAAQQGTLEALAATALARVGLTQDTAQPKYSVQVSVDVTLLGRPYSGYGGYSGFGMRSFGGFGGFGDGAPFGFMGEPLWYRHSVQLLLRDAASNQLAYETSARFEGPWSDTINLLPAMLEAALQGYPRPPGGLRKIVVELPPGERP